MTPKEPLDSGKPPGVDPQSGAARYEERTSEVPAKEEARRVPARGGEPHESDERHELHLAAPGDHSGRHDRGLTGDDEPDERGRLEECERSDDQIGPVAERARRVGDRLLEVWDPDRADQDRQAQPGDQQRAGLPPSGAAVTAPG